MKNNKKGISLMVLVLTIIIMVILAGTVIISLNNAGIIGRSQNTVSDYNLKQIEEMANVAWGEAYLTGNTTEPKLEEYVLDYLERNGVATEKYIITVTNKGVTVRRNNWVVACAKTNDNWTRYTQGQKIEGEIVIRLYPSSTPNMYDAVVEGNGAIDMDAGMYEGVLFGGFCDLLNENEYSNIKTVEIKEGITSITGLCNGLKSLESVILPSSITNIGYNAFSYTTNLKTINIPDSVTTIGNCAFEYSGLESITLPNNITTIGDGVFFSTTNLKTINIPDSVTSIGYNAFSGSGLESITLPDNLTTIGDSAFSYTTNLKTINIPDSVTTIGGQIFSGSGLESITLSDNITYIGTCAFENTKLKEIKLPKDITSIGAYAFAGTQIEEITIPSKVTSIEDVAFGSNESLRKIKILSETLLDVDTFAFSTEGEVDIYVLNEEVKSIIENTMGKFNVHVVSAEEMENV